MDLTKYDGKHVRITDKWGETFTGMAEYGNYSFLECEYGGEEDGIFIEDCLIYNSLIASIEEIEVHSNVSFQYLLTILCPPFSVCTEPVIINRRQIDTVFPVIVLVTPDHIGIRANL